MTRNFIFGALLALIAAAALLPVQEALANTEYRGWIVHDMSAGPPMHVVLTDPNDASNEVTLILTPDQWWDLWEVFDFVGPDEVKVDAQDFNSDGDLEDWLAVPPGNPIPEFIRVVG